MEYIAPADDLSSLLAILPERLRTPLERDNEGLIEIVLDLGRKPEARYHDGRAQYLSDDPVESSDLEYATQRVGSFSGDNRAGIERTLHRISCIRNRSGKIIGLTCRVGRAITGTINIILDLIESGKSILFLGPPGVGKTTKLRETARVLADELGKLVIVIDTSNEIAGDGDVPHPAIGRARRMQVSHPSRQHAVMIEAVENHTPEVIIIDEIGTEPEAAAARTIAERGVSLIGTAHGNALENLLKNPTLMDLVGGVQTVILGDDEARRRGTQKTVLERAAQPTFDICIEILDRQTLAIHRNVAEAVDQLLRGWKIHPEIRRRDEVTGSFSVVQTEKPMVAAVPQGVGAGMDAGDAGAMRVRGSFGSGAATGASAGRDFGEFVSNFHYDYDHPHETFLRVYPYAVSKGQLERVIRTLQLPVLIAKSVDEADAILALRSYARAGAKIFSLAESKQIPIYIVRSNNVPQVQRALREALHLESEGAGVAGEPSWESDISDETEVALEETRQAITAVMDYMEPRELAPRRAYIRRLQHQLVEQFNLSSRSIGDEPARRLRILPPASTEQNIGYI